MTNMRAWWIVFTLGLGCIVLLVWQRMWWTAGAQAVVWALQIVVMKRRGLFSRGGS